MIFARALNDQGEDGEFEMQKLKLFCYADFGSCRYAERYRL